MISLAPEVVTELPIDQLGLLVLEDLISTKEWNEGNYHNSIRISYQGEAAEAIAEAFAWLRARAFVAKDPSKTSDGAIFVTRTGRRILEEGQASLQVHERLQVGLHASLHTKVSRQFLIGEYEQGVFVAMKAVEVRVRALGDFPKDTIGVELMTQAFKPSTGKLTDPDLPPGEQEGLMALFRGCYAVLRNPAGHREIDYSDVTEAAEAVATASMLMRILDRVEARLGT